MADISTELQAILEAVYGEEVRDSIHDAIDKMNSQLNDGIDHQLLRVDPTLSVTNAGADAAAVGTALEKALSYQGSIGGSIDFNTVTALGMYNAGALSDGYTKEQLHRPSNLSGTLVVIPVSNSSVAKQLYVNASAKLYTRALVNNTWSDWKEVCYKNETEAMISEGLAPVNTALEKALSYQGAINGRADFNAVTTLGMYNVVALDDGYTKEQLHRPSVFAGTLVVIPVSNSTLAKQIYINSNAKLYARALASSTWTDWSEVCYKNETLTYNGSLSGAVDFDTVLNGGSYGVVSASTDYTIESLHRPSKLDGTLLVLPVSNATRMTQIYNNTKGRSYIRSRASNSVWTGWQELCYKSDLDEIIDKGGVSGNSTTATLFDCGPWDYGRINLSTGKSVGNSSAIRNYCRTRLMALTDVVISPSDKSIEFWALYYADNDVETYLGYSNYSNFTNAVHVMSDAGLYPTAKYVRFLCKKGDNSAIVSIGDFLRQFKASVSIYGMYIHQAPRSKGVANMVQRALNLASVMYTLTNALPAQETGTYPDSLIPSGTTLIGMKYSSVREENAYMPQAVSFETFASAVLNPNSYLYSKSSPYPNSKTYYGAVCSSFVAYAYSITDVIPTTISFSTYEGFAPLPDYLQDPYHLEIGHMLNKKGNHITLVTDVIKDFFGKVLYYGLSEAGHPCMMTRYWTPEEIKERNFDAGFVPYYYKYVDSIPEDNSPNDFMVIDQALYDSGKINKYLAPRRGDKANWRLGETIEVDVLDAAEDVFTSYVLKNRDTGTVVIASNPIPQRLISLSNLASGRYELYLKSNSGSVSPSVYFTIMETAETYTVSGRDVTVTYGSLLGTPSAILFVNNNSSCSDYRAVRAFHVLTEEEISAGSCTVSKPAIEDLEYHDEEYEAPNGVWEMRVLYKTEYGMYSSDFADVAF